MDDQITRAIRIGEDNAVIIQLYQNFCANLQVETVRRNGNGRTRNWVANRFPVIQMPARECWRYGWHGPEDDRSRFF